jgi:uncharacterized repeat protein (TIGR02543 family)
MAAKIFEVGDVLPQGLVKITGEFYSGGEIFIYLNSDYENYFMAKSEDALDFRFGDSFYSYLVEDNTDYSSRTIDAIFDFSSLSESERTFNSGYYDGSNKVYWEEYIAGYSITFEENGGTTISDIEEATELPTPLPTPTKSGYTFVAWYYESNFQTRANAGDTIESNVTLYAKWHNLGSLFTEIADAIRSKDGTSESIRDVDFGERVKQIQGAIELTQAQYDALETKDVNTYYLIVEVE